MDDVKPDMGLEPIERARALDPAWYLGKANLDFDQTHILAPSWQAIASLDLVANPGDHIVREIAGRPVIVVRGEDGELRGFFNICQHRAGPLATCDGKGAARLRCAYHGWAYDLDGQLKAAPGMQDAQDFDTASITLQPIEIRQWGGLVWARARTETSPTGDDFEAVVAGISDYIAPEDLEGLRFHRRHVYEVDANWKVYADNYLEGYHLPYVHPGLTSLVDFPGYETELGDFWSVQLSEIEEATEAYGAGRALYFFIHPNTMLNILPGRMQTNRILANGPDKCLVEFEYFYAPGEEHRAEEDDRFADQVQDEDRMICEHVQKALASGAYRPGRLSPQHEKGLWAWHQRMKTIYATT